jgi:hypothetical protein
MGLPLPIRRVPSATAARCVGPAVPRPTKWGAEMHYRDEKPVAATAIVVVVVLGVSALVRLLNGSYEPTIGPRHPATSFVMAGK